MFQIKAKFQDVGKILNMSTSTITAFVDIVQNFILTQKGYKNRIVFLLVFFKLFLIKPGVKKRSYSVPKIISFCFVS
jgi:hypothetical protein